MKLTKLERAGFIFEMNNGFRLAVDIGDQTSIEKLTGMKVDAIFASHLHSDHFSLPQIKALMPKQLYISHETRLKIHEPVSFEVIEIKAGDEILINGVEIQVFSVDHGPNVSLPLHENFGFLINGDGQSIYFAGDMFYPSGIDVTNLDVDLALLPVGSIYTFGPEEALNFAKQFKRIGRIICMHADIEIGSKDRFIKHATPLFQVE